MPLKGAPLRMHFYSSSGINAYDRNSLSFYSLYTLRQETLQSRLPDAISPALREAFDIIDMITEKHLGNNRYTSSGDKSSADYTRLSHPLLKWMLISGSADNGRSVCI
jgi:hypothetical protein